MLRGAQKDTSRWLFAPTASYRRLFFPGCAVSFALIVLGAICLAVDLARPEKMIQLFINPSSLVAWGAWLIALAIVLAAILIGLWGMPRRIGLSLVRGVHAVLFAVSIGLILYTGFLLGSIAAVPLWATPWLPVLFVLSSLSCGIAVVFFTACFSGVSRLFGALVRRLLAMDAVLIILEIAVVFLIVLAAFRGNSISDIISGAAHAVTPSDGAALLSVSELLCSDAAWVFWFGFIAVGLLAPLALECMRLFGHADRSTTLCTIASFVLLGGFAMRYCIVMAGVHPAVVSIGPML